jgi:nondiscriminating aspartyl-tRNA synthetase
MYWIRPFDKWRETTGMEYSSGKEILQVTTHEGLRHCAETNQTAVLHGAVHNIRDMGNFAFIIVRIPAGLVQCIWDKSEKDQSAFDLLRPESTIELSGEAHIEPRAPGGIEIRVQKIIVLSSPAEELPINLSRRELGINLDTDLNLRPITIRSGAMRARFRIQAAVVRGFREFLDANGFTDIRTPKIVGGNAEGGTNVFRLDYFGKKGFLAQSPQFYKQTMVGAFERVYEIGPVFRAEKHSTNRHLNEYISMDFEMGYIRSFTDIMDMETACLAYIFDLLRRDCARECEALKVVIPVIEKIPTVKFRDAKELIAAEYGHKIRDPYDLEPVEEQLISRYFKETYDSELVFVTHYPVKKRPFYAKDDPEDSMYTLSFDLLFRGMEITTGGQRIHEYQEQVDKMISKGLDPEGFTNYLMIHKYGMPPHGGLGLGLERLCMKLFDDNNVRYSALFPRDMNRLEP